MSLLVLAYLVLAYTLYSSMGPSVGAFAIVPTIFIAYLYGTRYGLLAGLLGILTNGAIEYLASGGSVALSASLAGGSIPGNLALILSGLVVGRLSDLQKQLKQASASRHSLQRDLDEIVSSIPEYLWSARVDSQGNWTYDYYSPTVMKVTGRPPEYFTAGPDRWLDIIHPDDQTAMRRVFQDETSGQLGDIETEYRIVLPNGETRWVFDRVHISPLDDGGIRLFGLVGDITERKRAEEQQNSHLWLLEGLDKINLAMQGATDLEQMMSDVLDQVIELLACDRAWLLFPADPKTDTWTIPMERTAPEYPGLGIMGMEVPNDPQVAELIRTLIDVNRPVQMGVGLERPLPDIAEEYQVKSQMMMIIYPAIGKPYAFGIHQCSHLREWNKQEVRLFEEIGRRLATTLATLQTQEALKDSELHLIEAERTANLGYWDWNLQENRIKLSDEAYRIFFGKVLSEPFEDLKEFIDAWQGLVLPEDRMRTMRAILETANARETYTVEYQIRRPDKEVRSLRGRGNATLDGDGEVARMFGTVQDITEYRELEDAFDRALADYHSLFENVSEGVYRSSLEGELLAANPTLIEMLGYDTFEELKELDVGELYVDPTRRENLMEELHSKGRIRNSEINLKCKDGSEITVLDNSHLAHDANGDLLFSEGIITDITELRQQEQELSRAYDATIEGLGRVLDMRDRETLGHSQRVAYMTVEMAKLVGIEKEGRIHIRRGALLHDIGKVAIPDDILFKEGKLTSQEWVVMKRHPGIAYEMLKDIEHLHPALDIPHYHHEKWDGSGYPKGLKGEEIPLAARLFSVADVWDALLSKRPYREAWPESEVLAYVREHAGSHFDPRLADIFLSNYDKLKKGSGAIEETVRLELEQS